MTVKIYVAQDSTGKEWAPDHPHEVESVVEILRRIWEAYHHLQSAYCIVANMHDPNADMVIVSERGLGILEFKHNYGKITIASDGTWYAGDHRIKGGSYPNPHKQVQAYGETIRNRLLPLILPTWLKKTPERWNEVKFQTAVCFTNPNADLAEVKQIVPKSKLIQRKPWEDDFSVISTEEVVNWVLKLRFGIDQGFDKRFEPLRLSPSTMVNALTLVFGAVEWEELLSSMPTGLPYGYLSHDSSEGEQKFNLLKDKVIIGRSTDCDLVVPPKYGRVSKVHCQINRTINGIEVEDLGSSNHTYVDGKRVSKPTTIRQGQVITLAGAAASEKSYTLRFKLHEHNGAISTESPSTEILSQT